MKILTPITDYYKTLSIAKSTSNIIYNKSVTFHCYWNGNLSNKHYYSILSFYYYNVYNNKHKIILWTEKQ